MTKPLVLYLVTEPWYFVNHRLDHAKALLGAGFDVHVATRRGDRWDEIEAAGCTAHEVELSRRSGGLRGWLAEAMAIRGLVRTVRPDLVHAVALKPLAVSLFLLPMRSRPNLVLSVNGLGLTAATGGRRLRFIRGVIAVVSRLPRVELLFQTRADQRAVVGDRGVGTVIPGVGVDTARFIVGSPPPTPPCVVVYLGRAVVSKGLLDLAEAVEREPVEGVELHLYCAADRTSPGSLTDDDMQRLERCPTIVVHPPTRDAAGVLGGSHGAILPSLAGEGVSKFVLESLATGVPVLLSAESGSAEVIESGATGLVFRACDPDSIRWALATLAAWSADERAAIRIRCRESAEQRFALDVILPQVVDLHRRALRSEA